MKGGGNERMAASRCGLEGVMNERGERIINEVDYLIILFLSCGTVI